MPQRLSLQQKIAVLAEGRRILREWDGPTNEFYWDLSNATSALALHIEEQQRAAEHEKETV